MPHNSPEILVFKAKDLGKIPMASTPINPKGALNRGGICYNGRFSTNVSLYVRNGAT